MERTVAAVFFVCEAEPFTCAERDLRLTAGGGRDVSRPYMCYVFLLTMRRVFTDYAASFH